MPRAARRLQYLTAGDDFDTVVLAVSMGAYKPFGTEKGFCAELIAQGGPFANFVDKIAIVPSLGVQLWSPRTLAELAAILPVRPSSRALNRSTSGPT